MFKIRVDLGLAFRVRVHCQCLRLGIRFRILRVRVYG